MQPHRKILSSKHWRSSRLRRRSRAQRLELTMKVRPGKPSLQNSPQVFGPVRNSSQVARVAQMKRLVYASRLYWESVIREREHDDVATDRQGRVGSYREAGLGEWLIRPEDQPAMRQCRRPGGLAQPGARQASKLVAEPR